MEKYLVVTLVLALLSFVYLKLAERFNIVDKPNERSSHTVPTIRGGGIIFLFAVWMFFITSNYQYPFLILGTTLIGLVSFLDDLFTLSSKLRLPFQFLAIILVIADLHLYNFPLWIPFLFIILGVGFINEFNFMDGINGITGFYSLAILIPMYFINYKTPVLREDLILYLGISVLVFGFYNFRKKARFFAGDIGSISMAIVLFFMSLILIFKLEAPIIGIIAIVYCADGTITLVYRKCIGENITEGHRHHLYQKMVDVYGFSHLAVSAFYAGVQLLVGYLIYKTYQFPQVTQYIIGVSVCLLFVIAYGALFFTVKKTKEKQIA